MRTILVCLVFAVSSIAFAQVPGDASSVSAGDPVAKPVEASSLDKDGNGKIDADEVAEATVAETTPEKAVSEVSEVYDAVKAKDSMPRGMFWALLLSAVFKLLLSTVKILGKNVAWFSSKEGKRVFKYSTLGLGAAAAVAANFALGWGWSDALSLLLSGPLAVAIHEYTKDSKEA